MYYVLYVSKYYQSSQCLEGKAEKYPDDKEEFIPMEVDSQGSIKIPGLDVNLNGGLETTQAKDLPGSPARSDTDGGKSYSFQMPKIGFGTSLVKGGAEFFRKVVMEYGYRHLDTASRYGNEEEVGEALQACFKAGINREELFITTKLGFDDKNDVERGLRESLKRLKLDYVDMYLIHWMRPKIDFESFRIKSRHSFCALTPPPEK